MNPPTKRHGVSFWQAVLAIALLFVLGAVWIDWHTAEPPEALAQATYVGRQACIECHQSEHDDWHGSHHDDAMDLATDATVLADFNNTSFTRNGVTTRFFRDGERFMVNAEGPDGVMTDYEVKYTFGVEPLQQYMVELEPGDDGDGRVQVLRVSWDTQRGEWYEVTPPDVPDERLAPDDPLHWTGVAQNWNTTCAECHSTNLQKNYDLATDSYRTTWSEIDVSCESCHGPASLHVKLANARSLFWDRRHGYGLARLKSADSTAQIETCATCHSRRNAVHANFRPGSSLLDSYTPALLDPGLYHADGQILDEVYVHGSFTQSKMHAKGVRCTDCHNPHSLKPKFDGNALCAQCHEPAKFDVVAHHHHPGLAGTAGTNCVDCHMPATTYMGIDARRDHSLRVPRPDLTVAIGTPNACNGCHTAEKQDATWAAAKVAEWYGDQPFDDAHGAEAIAAGRRGERKGQRLLTELIRRQETPAITRATAVDLLSSYPTAGAQALVVSQLNAADPLVRLAATRGVQAPNQRALVDTLSDRLTDPSRAVRQEAARRLAGTPLELLNTDQYDALRNGLTDYRAALSLTAERAASHMGLADIARRSGDNATAIDELRTAIRLEPYLTGPRNQLAIDLTNAGGDPAEIRRLREQEADNLRRDAELLPDNAAVQYRLGLLLFQLEKLEEARDGLTEACRLAPENYDFRMTLALLEERRYEQSGEPLYFDAALASLKKLEQISSVDPRAAIIYRRMTATQKAWKAKRKQP